MIGWGCFADSFSAASKPIFCDAADSTDGATLNGPLTAVSIYQLKGRSVPPQKSNPIINLLVIRLQLIYCGWYYNVQSILCPYFSRSKEPFNTSRRKNKSKERTSMKSRKEQLVKADFFLDLSVRAFQTLNFVRFFR